ncbi:hypothetical protein, partial [Luedemannella flava]|uniref:hypothetical protein n=1 Tax=Luedemannella flava TaxID=349316 RepID=UPI0031DACE31
PAVPAAARAQIAARTGPPPTPVRLAAGATVTLALAADAAGALLAIAAFDRHFMITILMLVLAAVLAFAAIRLLIGATRLTRDGDPAEVRRVAGFLGVFAVLGALGNVATHPTHTAAYAMAAALAVAAYTLPAVGSARTWLRARRDLTHAHRAAAHR